MDAVLARRMLPNVGCMRRVFDSTSVRPCATLVTKVARRCILGVMHAPGLGTISARPDRSQIHRELQGHRTLVSSAGRSSSKRMQRSTTVRASTRPDIQSSNDAEPTELLERAPIPSSPISESSLETPTSASSANSPPPQLPALFVLLALRIPACQRALTSASPHFSRLTASTVAAGRLVLWFVSGQYIPSQRKVLFTLLRAERFYRTRICTIDGRQLLHEVNFLPELPDVASFFPVLGYAFVLLRAVLSSVSALGSVDLGSAAVPGLPEVELPTFGRSVALEYPDKSDQPETPGYKPLGEWVGPRGMKPWERNEVTITPEKRKKLWEKNFDEYSLHPFNSTPKERRILVALAAISTVLTHMWIVLHGLLLPFIFLGVMYAIEKPLFWLLAQLYKGRKLIGDYKGPLSNS